MSSSLPGRRLCVLVDAGPTPCALDALSVREVLPEGVAPPGPVPRTLSALLGGERQGAAGLTLVMDAQPGFSLAVQRVRGVVDVAGAQTFQLPHGVSPALARVASGALLLDGQVYLELDARRLAEAEAEPSAPPQAVAEHGEPPPGRALLFRAGGERWAVPLGSVVRVAAAEGLCPTSGRTAGLLVSGGALWPALAIGGGAGASTAVFVEHEGRPLALLVDEVLGIHGALEGTEPECGAPWLALGPLFA